MKDVLLKFQKAEIQGHVIYKFLAQHADEKNSRILERIAQEELNHYRILRKYTGKDVKPPFFSTLFMKLLALILGYTFVVKMMELSEKKAELGYEAVLDKIPEAKKMLQEEQTHEDRLIAMLEEERIGYIGSMVLGLNDALVELTGTLAGLTFALRNTSIVGIAGLITGIAASLSMAASEYLSEKSEKSGKSPAKAAIYTGIAYIITVALLILPFFLIHNAYFALLWSLFDAFVVILLFTFFVSVVKEEDFGKLFVEMLLISFGVALVSFVIGVLARRLLNVEV